MSTFETLVHEPTFANTQDEAVTSEPHQAALHESNGDLFTSNNAALDSAPMLEDEPTVDIDDEADNSITIGTVNESASSEGLEMESMKIEQTRNDDIEQKVAASSRQSGSITEIKSVDDETEKQQEPLTTHSNVAEPVTLPKESLPVQVKAESNESVPDIPLDDHKTITLISDIPRKVEENVEEENGDEENAEEGNVEPISASEISNTDQRVGLAFNLSRCSIILMC